eukprot:Blabericola_migrator_1__4107@NODE_224_length_11141_cov_42_071880_g190_i0_p17_GENE_NODE_224_length_11141_cov_42_071880_g190_i0NODE_224_length_11141_cov_42_071880_g190_i0_p17_ORF_typecomplete_len106_score11_43_NODE_224_length_11141_cov_42_071880_g190_i084748791
MDLDVVEMYRPPEETASEDRRQLAELLAGLSPDVSRIRPLVLARQPTGKLTVVDGADTVAHNVKQLISSGPPQLPRNPEAFTSKHPGNFNGQKFATYRCFRCSMG